MPSKIVWLLLIATLAASPARAAFNDIITGARPQGMGGAFVAVADDSNALYWNPAGLTQLDSAEVTFMHANQFDITTGPELNTDFVGFVNWPMNFGTMGVSFFQQGNSRVLQERTLQFTYARDFATTVSGGINVKYLEFDPSGQQVNPNDPALQEQGTFSFDLSGLYTVTPYWRIGFLARNILGELGTAEREELRTTYRLGSAYRFEDVFFHSDAFIWSLDLFTREDVDDEAGTKLRAATGIEYSIDERFSIRAGVNNGNFAAGLGLGHPESGIFVDYAFSDDDPGTTHRISATYRFGGPPGEVHVVHHTDKVVHHHKTVEKKEEPPLPPPPPVKKGPVEGKAIVPESPVNPRPAIARGSWRTGAARLGAPPARRSGPRYDSQLDARKARSRGNDFDREVTDFLEE